MRSHFFAAVLGFGGLLLAAPPARAQLYAPYPGYYDNGIRPYQHFLNSRYSYRTYSAFPPGVAVSAATRLRYDVTYTGPGLVRERITPAGLEGFRYVGPQGGYTLTPQWFSAYSVPGYEYLYYLPARPGP